MKYTLEKERIIIEGKDDFNPQHILECGQVFSYSNVGNVYKVFPADKYAEIIETQSGYELVTRDIKFFENYFDLKTDYNYIKRRLSQFKILEKPLQFGYGIRILKQDLFEMLISFIISANNNIKRIQLILNRMREKLGVLKNQIKAFPSYEILSQQSVEFFKEIGAGYRAPYLERVLKQITPYQLEEWNKLDTVSLRKNLLSLYGVGPKVADCILLFGYGRGDVFPVDTWIHQMYNSYYPTLENRNQIRDNLVKEFGGLAGYAQQYLFYYQRSGI